MFQIIGPAQTRAAWGTPRLKRPRRRYIPAKRLPRAGDHDAVCVWTSDVVKGHRGDNRGTWCTRASPAQPNGTPKATDPVVRTQNAKRVREHCARVRACRRHRKVETNNQKTYEKKSAEQLCKRDEHVARGRGKGHVVNAAGFAHAAVARAGLLATSNRSNASGGSDVAVVRLWRLRRSLYHRVAPSLDRSVPPP